MNVLHLKRMLYYQRGAFSGLGLHVYSVCETRPGELLCKTCIVVAFRDAIFVCAFGHNLQTIGCVPNYLSTIVDIVFRL